MKSITVIISGMNCAACSAAAERALNKIDSVTATVNLASEKAYIEYDEAKINYEILEKAIADAGFKMHDEKSYALMREQQKLREHKIAKIKLM